MRPLKWISHSSLLLIAVAALVGAPAAAQPPHGGYSGVHVGGYVGGTNRGHTGVYVGGYVGGTTRGFTGTHVGGPAHEPYPSPSGYRFFYAPQGEEPYFSLRPPDASTVGITVRVQANAQLWVQGKKTTQGGGEREFISPRLIPGENYTYTFRARWMKDGQAVEQTRKVVVHAGEQLRVDFATNPKTKPASEKQ
jgi:uncharacterized protein (TIGR03000 family)